MYSHLEALLCRSRDAFTSAPEEYDQACHQHDSEMDTIRQALMAKTLLCTSSGGGQVLFAHLVQYREDFPGDVALQSIA
jgi:hypothetical protein